jgi:diguanylate cyclase
VECRRSRKEAAEFARQAIAMMADERIVPHPNNFAVWYNYFADGVPDLKKTLDALLNSHQAVSEESSMRVFRKYCASPYDVLPLHIMAEKMEIELSNLLVAMEQAGQGAQRYAETLENASGEMARDCPVDAVKALIGRLLVETRSMLLAKDRGRNGVATESDLQRQGGTNSPLKIAKPKWGKAAQKDNHRVDRPRAPV